MAPRNGAKVKSNSPDKAPIGVRLERSEIFRMPSLPQDQVICDVMTFTVGTYTFVAVTTLCHDRTRTGPTQVFRVTTTPPFRFDPEPILKIQLYHPRNLAVGPEGPEGRWIWFADHGLDGMPFPGGCCPLFLINEKGQVKEKRDPLLERLEFSFDGCIWENPATRELYLYQSNIGQFSPKLFRWRSEDSPGEDLSSLLPSELVNREERFLVSRILTNDAIGTGIFLGGDYSCESQTKYGNDSVLRIGYSGQIERARDLFPPRLKDATWSTVEVRPFARNSTGEFSLLVITHDFGFNEGAAEVLNLSHDRKTFIRPDRPLPLPSLEGTRSWIARAAIGDLDGDGRADIVLYLRSKDGPFPESSNNLMLLRQNKQGEFDYASCQASGYDTHFAGGFFLSGSLIQLRYDGLFEETRFSF